MKAHPVRLTMTFNTPRGSYSESFTAHFPDDVIELHRRQLALRKPCGFDVSTASATFVMQRACRLTATVRCQHPAPRNARARALKWAPEWLQAGCPGASLPHPRASWRAARMPGDGIAIYRGDTDEAVLWLTPPPWSEQSPFEEIWYASAAQALKEAA
jgi:hypothetical protein